MAPTLPLEKAFYRLLSASLPRQVAAGLMRAAAARYPALLAAYPQAAANPLMEKRVLPALALYQALLESGLDGPEALRLLEPVVLEAYFGRLRRGIALFARLPLDPFPLLRPALRMMARSPDGSPPEILADTPDRLVVHTRRCPILDALRDLGAPELATIFCASDDWLASALPRVRWLRTTTLARGGPLCDFHWERT